MEENVKRLSWRDLKDFKNQYEDTADGYYHYSKDLYNFPDAWCIIVWSPRGSGKTYSALWRHIYTNETIMYLKRTVEDVDTICGGKAGVDMSPYIPINRDKLTNIVPVSIGKGLGGFYKSVDGEPDGLPVSYILALNKIKSVKGIEASRCSEIILDEFIPQLGERVSQKEGKQLLSLYMTVLRDRVARGNSQPRLVLFANAEEISTPITNELEIVDYMAELNAIEDYNIMYLEDKGIVLHRLLAEESPIVEKQFHKLGIYRALKDTAWGRTAFEGDFASNDFTNVTSCNLKNMKILCCIKRNTHNYYVYVRHSDGFYYMTTSASDKCSLYYDTNLENDQKRFYNELYFTLREACVEGRMKFKKYSMYDFLINYKKFFKL